MQRVSNGASGGRPGKNYTVPYGTDRGHTGPYGTEEETEPEEDSKREYGADKPPTRTRFVPPTLDEVTAYVKERGSKVDPQGFIDFYAAAKGWLVGKTPMKDWKAACRNAEHWERWGKPQPTDRNRLRTDADYMGGGDFFGGGD